MSLESWDDIWRRNQFLAREWGSMGSQVAFVGPGRDVTYAVRSGQFSTLIGGTSVPATVTGVKASRPWKLAPNKFRWGAALNDLLWRSHLRSRFPIQLHDQTVLWVNDHSCAAAIKNLKRSCLIYDITDDWTQFQQAEPAMRRTRETDRWLCENADAVIVCSEGLFESKKDIVPKERLFLVPNGVDIEHYSRVSMRRSNAGQIIAEPMALARGVVGKNILVDGNVKPGASAHGSGDGPVFGYTGTIHNQRLDVALVEQIAQRMTSGSIRFVGPEMLPAEDRIRLINTGRVEFTRQKAYDELPELMSQMDVMIVPHLVTPFTESLNPLKLWEYLAAGLPVVSTPVAGFRDYPNLVYLAGDADSFLQGMQDALQEDSGQVERRRHAVAGNTWTARINSINEIIQFAIANPRNTARTNEGSMRNS